jgi:dissimilatory sulfite reductase (desulfoviridin) alpha/beta subunit
MPQAAFTTAHKCLTYYVDIPETQDIAETYGSHLQHLTQLQKYEIITSLSMWLWYLTEDELLEDLEPEEEEFDDFVESFFGRC